MSMSSSSSPQNKKWTVEGFLTDIGVEKQHVDASAKTLINAGFVTEAYIQAATGDLLIKAGVPLPIIGLITQYQRQQEREKEKKNVPRKRIRTLQGSKITTNRVVRLRLSIDADKMLNINPLAAKTVNYFGRPGLQELFEKLVDDQTDERFFNISVVGPPGIGKSTLVFAAAEHIAYARKKSVLWVGRRVEGEKWNVKLFSASDNADAAGDLIQPDVSKWSSLEEILDLPLFARDVKVLVVDAPTRANTSTTGDAGTGIAALEWAGKNERIQGRRVIHVSSLGSFADNKQTIRDHFNLQQDLTVALFTRSDYIQSLSDPDLKKQVCETLQIEDPNSISNEDVVDQKLFFAGINARWFYNRSIEEIKKECEDITKRLDSNVSSSSTGPKDPRAVNSALATVHGGGKVTHVYTSCHLAQYIGSQKGNYYYAEFLKLFPFVEHTPLGCGTPGDVFESDFRFHLEQSHNIRDAQVAVMGPDNAEDVMVVLGKRCGDGSNVLFPAGQINPLRSPPADQVAHQRTYLLATTAKKVPQWFIPESKQQPFLDFMVLIPHANDTWKLIVIQNTVGKKHSADKEQLKRVVGGVCVDGFVLDGTITIVYVIKDCTKSGKIAASLHDSNLDIGGGIVFRLEVVHSAYSRIATVPE